MERGWGLRAVAPEAKRTSASARKRRPTSPARAPSGRPTGTCLAPLELCPRPGWTLRNRYPVKGGTEMKIRALPMLAVLALALSSPLLAAEDPQAPYQKPAMD